MLVRAGAAAVAISLVVLGSGCARKKPAPPRGAVIGSAEFSAATPLEEKAHCLQAVKLSSGAEVIEISSGECPAEGVASQVTATLRITQVKNLLTIGESSVQTENVPVARYTVDSNSDGKNHYTIHSLCQTEGRLDFASLCEVHASSGVLKSIEVKKKTSVDEVLLEMGIQNLENADQIKKEIGQVREDIVSAREALAALDLRISGSEQSSESLSQSIRKIEDRVAALKTEYQNISSKEVSQTLSDLENRLTSLKSRYSEITANSVNESLKALETRLGAINGDITKVNSQETKDALSLVENRIKALSSQIDAAKTWDSQSYEKLNSKMKQMREQMENLEKSITKATSQEIADQLKKVTDAISALEQKLSELLKKIKDTETEQEQSDTFFPARPPASEIP